MLITSRRKKKKAAFSLLMAPSSTEVERRLHVQLQSHPTFWTDFTFQKATGRLHLLAAAVLDGLRSAATELYSVFLKKKKKGWSLLSLFDFALVSVTISKGDRLVITSPASARISRCTLMSHSS